ncbi:hypothetical protein [Rosistilla oblonga]
MAHRMDTPEKRQGAKIRGERFKEMVTSVPVDAILERDAIQQVALSFA